MLKTLLKSALVMCAIVAVNAEAKTPLRRNTRRTNVVRKAVVARKAVCTKCQL